MLLRHEWLGVAESHSGGSRPTIHNPIAKEAMSKVKVPIEHAVARSTVRLLAAKTGTPSFATGTGFFYRKMAFIARISSVTQDCPKSGFHGLNLLIL